MDVRSYASGLRRMTVPFVFIVDGSDVVDCVFVLLESDLEECFDCAFSCGEKYVADCLVAVLIDCGAVFCWRM